uniref:CCHC-type domain-containing protein n=1 Tax=Anopheles melas TaxID=34690 RepID=A0A182TUN4_9DIPT
MVTSTAQNFLTTGTTNGATMSSTGNNGATGSGVVSGGVLINQAAVAVQPQPGQFVYAGTPATFPQIGLLQQTKVPGGGGGTVGSSSVGVYGATSTLPYTSAAPSCYNCGSLKHTGLDCPEASMEDMTRTSNFTLDYNTISNSATSPSMVTTPTTTTIPLLTVTS